MTGKLSRVPAEQVMRDVVRADDSLINAANYRVRLSACPPDVATPAHLSRVQALYDALLMEPKWR